MCCQKPQKEYNNNRSSRQILIQSPLFQNYIPLQSGATFGKPIKNASKIISTSRSGTSQPGISTSFFKKEGEPMTHAP